MKKRVSIYIDSEVWEKLKKVLKNVSAWIELKAKEYLKIVGEEIKEKEPKLVVEAYCPSGHLTKVVLIDGDGNFKSKLVYCEVCGRRFTLRRRVRGIIKGNMNLYMQWYAKAFKTSYV
jgi:transcription elongation factor Elf1